jgi:hypothetical protein
MHFWSPGYQYLKALRTADKEGVMRSQILSQHGERKKLKERNVSTFLSITAARRRNFSIHKKVFHRHHSFRHYWI